MYRNLSNRTADHTHAVVQVDIISRGFQYSVPFSRDSAYDIIVDKGNHVFETIQIKTIDGYHLRCTTRPLYANETVTANGKTRNNYHYRDLGIDWIVGVRNNVCLYYPLSVFENYDTIDVRSVLAVDFGYARIDTVQYKRFAPIDPSDSLFEESVS